MAVNHFFQGGDGIGNAAEKRLHENLLKNVFRNSSLQKLIVKYNFNIHRNDAITNVQIKPHSSHDPNILDGVFKGFVQRALTLCSQQYITSEIQFLILRNSSNPRSLFLISSSANLKRLQIS